MRKSLRFGFLLLFISALATSVRGELESVRFLMGKREIPVSPPAVTDGSRVLVPLVFLKMLGISHTGGVDGKNVTVIGQTQSSGEVEAVNLGGTLFVPLHQVLSIVGGDVTVDPAARAASIRANLTAVEFTDGLLRASFTLPVVCTISTWAGKLIVDVSGARLATEAKEVYVGDDVVTKVRLGQYTDDTVRIVLDLAKSASHRIESSQPSAQLLVRVGENLLGSGQTKSENQKDAASVQDSPPQPFDITGIRIETVSENAFELVVDTSRRAVVNLTKSSQPAEITLFFKGGTLAELVTEVVGTHPLVVGARFARGSADPALARVHLNLARPVLTDVRVEDSRVRVSVRLPDKAGGRLADKLIVIDPGHGGLQSGARVGDVKEKDVNLRIAAALAEELRKVGAKVIHTRETDVTLDLSPRPAVAIKNNADFFISLHCNSNIKPNSVSGIETYYYRDGESPRLLAQAIQKAVCKATGMTDRGARNCGFKVLRLLDKTGIPGVLIECGYLNHSRDRAKLLSADYRRKLAEGIVDGLRLYVEGPRE